MFKASLVRNRFQSISIHNPVITFFPSATIVLKEAICRKEIASGIVYYPRSQEYLFHGRISVRFWFKDHGAEGRGEAWESLIFIKEKGGQKTTAHGSLFMKKRRKEMSVCISYYLWVLGLRGMGGVFSALVLPIDFFSQSALS
jgi:hypothetical protein